jgi:hypothetical protein
VKVALRPSFAAAFVAALLTSSCKFQDLSPSGSRRDETAMQATVTAFYRAIAAHDAAAVQRVTYPAATTLLQPEHGAPVLVPIRTMIDVPERRNQHGGVRVVRSDLRIDGELATDHLVVTAAGDDGRREYEASDFVTLARRDGGWRIAHVALGPWRVRSAP